MRLTHIAAGAGCGCKLGPAQLAGVLGQIPRQSDPRLLVGFETSDDAALFLLPDGQALVQTVDFFTPVVDDAYDYGQIAAANALSDCYAMGGTPLSVLNVACFDPELAPAEVWAAVFQGMADKTAEAGAVVAGGHTVDDPVPKFGMCVTGVVDPARALRNDQARPGDRLWLSKPLGAGIAVTAAKSDAAPPEVLAAAVDGMKRLNAEAARAALAAGARCATDVTGFGLAGHLSHMVRASGVAAEVGLASLPVIEGVRELAEAGYTTGGARRNRLIAPGVVELPAEGFWLEIVTDPQTSGGLLVACEGEVEGSVEVGRVVEGPPAVRFV